jgi:ABC-type branched-subunit amino acid transport system ATPase component/ABC-type branched-subunit amino acid transport system permease subunit
VQSLKKRYKYLQIFFLLFVLILLLLLPFFLNAYYVRLLQLIGVYVLLATGLNLVTGYTGQVSLGHGGLYGVGAYTSALLATRLGLSFWAALLLSVLVAAAFGVILGFPSLRVRGPYLAMVTIGFGIIIEKILVEWTGFTGGPVGIMGISAPQIGKFLYTGSRMYFLILLLVGIGLVLAHNLINSKWGRAFVAIRENEIAAGAMGVNIRQFKVIAFTLSAAYAGAAGSLYAHMSGYISPDSFNLNLSIFSLLLIVVGGMGTIAGPVVGAAVLTFLPEALHGFDKYRLLIYGALLIVSVLAMQEGIVGLVRRKLGPEDVPQGPDQLPEKKTLKGGFLEAGRRNFNGNILELVNVSKSFGGLTAVNCLNLKVAGGTIHSLIGPNGAGKSTVINLISGFYRPDSGEIKFKGRILSVFETHIQARSGIARTFQNLQLYQKASVLDNVLVGMHLRIKEGFWSTCLKLPAVKRSENAARQEAMALLCFLGLERYAEMPAEKLPYGHQKLLEIARALALQPDLLLLDEPAAGLNETEVMELAKIITQIKEKGVTVLLVEHQMNLVMEISDYITVIDYGKKIAEGPPEVIQNDQTVIQAYLGTEVA